MSRRVVIVDGVRAASHRWASALEDVFGRAPDIVGAMGEAGALAPDDVLVVDLPALDRSVLGELHELASSPRPHVLLAADHGELPLVLQSGVDTDVAAVFPRAATGENVAALARDVLRGGERPSTADPPREDWDAVADLLRWTISTAVRVPGVFIRSYRGRGRPLEVQLVFRTSQSFEDLQCELPRRWGWPARIGREVPGARTRPLATHRSLDQFGDVQRDQLVYVKPIAGTQDAAYLALLPWADDERITVAIGLCADAKREDLRREALMKELHARAVTEVPRFSLPERDETKEGVRHSLEYDWVITRDYAGPDRRSQDTPIIGRYMFVGRRKTLAKSLRERAGGFVDGAPGWVGAYFLAYVVLALIDTVCTWGFVGAGAAVELNPVLAPLIGHHPWLFLFAKNGCALAAFAIIVRFHLFKKARIVLRASVAAYALLDVYWTILLLAL